MDTPSFVVVAEPGEADTLTQRTIVRKINAQSAPKILQKKVEPELTDDEEHSDESEDLEVYESKENVDYQNKLLVGKLSRLSYSRGIFRNRMQRFAVMMCFLNSCDTLMKFSATLDKYGLTFAYLFVFLIFFLGYPVMYLELAIGQYTFLNAYSIFSRMAPGLGGVGILAALHNLWYILTTQTAFNFSASIFMQSINIFSSDLPWHSCSMSTNTAACRHLLRPNQCPDNFHNIYRWKEVKVPLGELCVSGSSVFAPKDNRESLKFSIDDFHRDPMLQFAFAGYDMETMQYKGYPSSTFLFSVILTSFLVYALLRKSQKSTLILAQLTTYMCLITGAVFVALFFVTSAKYRYIYALEKNRSIDWNMFIETVFLVLRALKLGQGGLIFMGAQNDIHSNFHIQAILYCCSVCGGYVFYSLFHLFIVNSALLTISEGNIKVLDRFAKESGFEGDANDRIDSGSVRYNVALFMMAMKQYGAFEPVATLFFTMFAILQTSTNMIIRYEIMLAMIAEYFPRLDNSISREFTLNILILVITMLNFLFATARNFYITAHIETIAFPVLASVTVLAQLFIILWCYGPTRMYANITFMMDASLKDGITSKVKRVLNMFLLLLWCGFIPIAIVSSLASILSLDVMDKVSKYGTAPYLILCCVVSLSMVVIVFISKAVDKYRAHIPLTELFKTNKELWGPQKTENREKAEHLEREIRSLW